MVRQRMMDVFRFWLRLGVDGFYLRNVHKMQFEAPEDVYDVLKELHQVLKDEEESSKRHETVSEKWVRGSDAAGEPSSRDSSTQLFSQKRILVTSRAALQALSSKLSRAKDKNYLSSFRSNVRKPALEVSQRVDVSRAHKEEERVEEEGDVDEGARLRSYGRTHERQHGAPLLHFARSDRRHVFSYFHLIDTFLDIKVNETENIRDQVNGVFLNDEAEQRGACTLWNVGSAVSSRLASRVGPERSAVAAFLLIMMPGSISVFYGDEVGLKDSSDLLSGRVSPPAAALSSRPSLLVTISCKHVSSDR